MEADPIGNVLYRNMALRNLPGPKLPGMAEQMQSMLYSQAPVYNQPYGYVTENPMIYSDPFGLVNNSDYWTEVGLGVASGVAIGAGLVIESPLLIAGGATFEVVNGIRAGYEAISSVKKSVALERKIRNHALGLDGGRCPSK